MTERPLRLGLSACFFHADPQRAIFKGKTLIYLEESLAHWAMVRGDMGFMMTTATEKVQLESYVKEIDGLVLSGGSDVSPETYGETPMRPEWNGDRIRDIYESELLHLCIKHDVPVLGVCRGLQIINAAMGGTLYQDINTQLDNKLTHRNWDIYDQNFHEITFTEGSWMPQFHDGKTGGVVNSVHHQSIKDVAPHFHVEATSTTDDIIEAIRYIPEGADTSDPTSYPYVYAVQWHPEFNDPTDPKLLSPYGALDHFLSVARAKKASTRGE